MQNKKPLVSIAVVNHNGKKLIKKCLDSLFKLNYPKNKWEVIVVDNCSQDDSVKFIKSKYNKVKIIENKVNNYCQACNLGIVKAKGKYVALLNNDVRVKPRWLAELVAVMDEDNSIGGVTSKLLKGNGMIQNVGLYELPDFYWDERGAGKESGDTRYNSITEVNSICGASILYRKEALNQVGLLDEDFGIFGEDVDICMRLKEKGWKLVYVPSSVAYHKMHGSCDESFSRQAIEKNRLLLIAKYYPYKLAHSLVGREYFLVNKDNQESGQFFDLLPDIFLKIGKHHSKKVAEEVMKEVFVELKRIVNYENKKLEVELRKLLDDLTETRKDRDYHKNEEECYRKEIEEKDKDIRDRGYQMEALSKDAVSLSEEMRRYKAEVRELGDKLKVSSDDVRGRNERIEELTKDAVSLSEEMRRYKDEVRELGDKLKVSLDNSLAKDNTIQELSCQFITFTQDINNYRQEIVNLDKRLKVSLDENLIKDRVVLDKERRLDEVSRHVGFVTEEFDNYKKEIAEEISTKNNSIQKLLKQESIFNEEANKLKQEVANLAGKLRESLDGNLVKEGVILENEGRITGLTDQLNVISGELANYKQEVANLAGKLRESLDGNLVKDNIIFEKTNQLRLTTDKLTEKEEELAGIYNSEGFKFILNPLWKIIWYGRLTFRFLIRKGYSSIRRIMPIILTPVTLIHFLFFVSERIAEILLGRISIYFKKKREVVAFDNLTVSVVIPNWNGIELLKKCLASIYEAEGFKQDKYEVLVVDDASSYKVAQCIKGDFPQVRVIRNRFNQGFGRTCNRGVKEAKGELIVLLNNDIMVSPNFLEPLKRHFQDEEVFAVAPKIYCWDKTTFNYGMHMGKFKDGYLSLWNEAETGNGDKVSQTSPTIFAVGGAMVFRKKDFLWLGGFDDIYRPNCWEDIDISYRAQKRGLKVLYEPGSLVYHKDGATVNYARHKEIKNELLFMWKNITDNRMLLSHFNQVPRFFSEGRHSHPLTFFRGYFWAFSYLIEALIHRLGEKKYQKVSDREVLNRCKLYYRNFRRNNYIHCQKKTVLLVTPFLIYPLTSGGKLRIYNLYKRLAEKYNLILLSLFHNEREEEHTLKLKEIFKEVYVVHPKTSNRDFLFPQRYKYSFSRFFIEKLKEIQDKTPIDLVHIESNEILYLTKYIKYAPIIYTEHDISILSYHKSYYNRRKEQSLTGGFIDYLKVVRHHDSLYRNIDKVITLSGEDTRVIEAFSPNTDCSLISTGVDLDHFTFSQKSGERKTLVFVGHYPHYPNEEAAVYFCRKILPLIKKVIPTITLKLVGSDPTEEVMKLSQIEGVEVIGTVEDVNPYLQESSVFVNAFRRSAGIKGKVLEAMATGTPVVCTRRGAYGIEALDNFEILIADKPKDFANRVIELLTNDELYEKIADNARRLVEEHYDWDKIAEQLDGIYKKTSLYYPLEEKDKQQVSFLERKEEKIEAKSSREEENLPKFENERTERRIFRKDEVLVGDIVAKVDKIIDASLECLNKDPGRRSCDSPQELHLELTHLCNSKCITCDIWDFHQRNNKTINDELSLDEIKNFIEKSKVLKSINTVVLSGGEPFLRGDLVDICVLMGKFFPQVSLGILTNGINTETIISKTKAILEKAELNSLWVGSSLDGLEGVYDKIRGTQGGFKRFLNTVERFKKEVPEVSFSTTFVLTPFNIDQLVPCWEFAEHHNLDFFAQFGVPKSARLKEVFHWQEEEFLHIKEYVAQIIRKMITKGSDLGSFYGSLGQVEDKINLLTKIYYWSHLVDFQQSQKRVFPQCNAASKFAMVDPYGSMFFCPLLKEKGIGNIREGNVDDLWRGKPAEKARSFIDSGKCSCWLVCTVFPIVGEALALHGDKTAANLAGEGEPSIISIERATDKDKKRIITIDEYRDKYLVTPQECNSRMFNSQLNDEEFRARKSILQSTPGGVTIGTNYRCNANCIFCPGGEYKPFNLKLYQDYFEPKLGKVLNQAEYVSFCGMGELLLVPGVEDFLEYINDKLGDKNKILTTNGLALRGGVLREITKSEYSIQISLHASNSKLHEQITGIKGGFEKIIEQIRYLVAQRKSSQSPHISLVFLVNTLNIEDLPDFVKLAASLGVDSVCCNYLTIFNPAQVKLSCFFKQEVTNEIFDKAKKLAKKLNVSLTLPIYFSQKDYPKGVCADPWKNIYIDTEGAVLPCCYSGEHYGELGEDDVISIWDNKKYQQIRGDLASENTREMCRNCVNNNPANVNSLSAHVSFRPQVQKAILGN
ncbi:MAG: glycosyltransferase [Candidatus Omnitrophica bacterium]|nr:glycosyltransferase [Candidatus Omnitrophota bacterium]